MARRSQRGARSSRNARGDGREKGVQKNKKPAVPFSPSTLAGARNREAGDKGAPTHRETEECVVFRKKRDREGRLVYPRERESEAQRFKCERDKPEVRSGTRKKERARLGTKNSRKSHPPGQIDEGKMRGNFARKTSGCNSRLLHRLCSSPSVNHVVWSWGARRGPKGRGSVPTTR